MEFTAHFPRERRIARVAAVALSFIIMWPGSIEPARAQEAAGAGADAAAVAVPEASSFQVMDCPNDEGSALLAVWGRPEKEVEGVRYEVEVAPTGEGFQEGKYKSVMVTPSAKALASSKPDYFGRSSRNEKMYFAEITPAKLFLPKAPEGPLTPEELAGFVKDEVITDAQEKRALAAIANEKPDEELTARERVDRKWWGRLETYLKTKRKEKYDAVKRKVEGEKYSFRLVVLAGGTKTFVEVGGWPVEVECRAEANLFKWTKLNNLVFSLTLSGVILGFIRVARQRPGLFIRRIAGLDAVEEAIGRSTEMNRPVLFVHGLGGVGDVATIASLNILAQVATRTAEYDSRVKVMNNDPLVTAVSQEVVQQAYKAAGRPDAYNPDDVPLVAYDQFSYVAAVSGHMVREKPGAIFLLGTFFAESLLLSETGASTGAIQVAGTDSYTQLPFFITTCDYTLIGEELYAASAYLTRDPRILGSLRGQDVGKAFLMITILVGTLVMTMAAMAQAAGVPVDLTWLRDIFKAAY